MLYKLPLISPIAVAYTLLSACFSTTYLTAQDLTTFNSSPSSSTFPSQATSNLITNNPFVPKNNGPLEKTKNPPGPKSFENKSQVLQKYLQFKSIVIINKKKYFSIFNKRTNKSFWISEGETFENFRVTYYNRTSNSISITDGINSEIIPITKANETPLSVVSATKQVTEEIAKPAIPGTTKNQSKEKPKTATRRRVIPAKR